MSTLDAPHIYDEKAAIAPMESLLWTGGPVFPKCGSIHHCSEKLFHRYLAKFEFRYNARAALGFDDDTRTFRALFGSKGKRLKYRDSSPASIGDQVERDVQ